MWRSTLRLLSSESDGEMVASSRRRCFYSLLQTPLPIGQNNSSSYWPNFSDLWILIGQNNELCHWSVLHSSRGAQKLTFSTDRLKLVLSENREKFLLLYFWNLRPQSHDFWDKIIQMKRQKTHGVTSHFSRNGLSKITDPPHKINETLWIYDIKICPFWLISNMRVYFPGSN